MKKKQIKNWLFYSTVTATFFSTSFIVSCSSSINNDVTFNINQTFFNQYNNEQIQDLVKFARIYNLKNSTSTLQYLNSKIANGFITFNDLNQKYVTKYEPKKEETREKINPQNLYVQYSQQNDLDNTFYLSTEADKKYKDKFFVPDIQIAIYKILSNKQNFNQAIPNWIDIDSIRSSSWIKNKEQISYLENLLTVQLKAFDIKSKDNRSFEKVKFTNLKNTDFSVTFNVELLDKEGKNLDNLENKTTFFINRFLNYEQATPQNLKIMNNDSHILFNEYLNFPSLDFKTNPLFFTTYDNFVDGNFNLYNIYTAKSFAAFLEKFPNLIVLNVPYEKRNEDQKYELTNKVEYADFPSNTYSVLKLEVKVTKKNGDVVFYPWYSIDFNKHYHLFKGYVPNLNLNYTQSDLWSYLNLRNKTNENFKVPKGIDANTFFQSAILNIVSYSFWKLRNNLVLWNNKPMLENEAFDTLMNPQRSLKYVENEISNLVLSYLIGNKQGDFKSGIKNVKLEYVGYQNPGSLKIKVDFLDFNNNSLLSKENQDKIILVNYFKGANTKEIDAWSKVNTEQTISLSNVPNLTKFEN